MCFATGLFLLLAVAKSSSAAVATNQVISVAKLNIAAVATDDVAVAKLRSQPMQPSKLVVSDV